MKIENIECASDILRKIKYHEESINHYELKNALSIRIELQYSGGRTEIDSVEKGTIEYDSIVDIMIKPAKEKLKKLHSEFYNLDRQ